MTLMVFRADMQGTDSRRGAGLVLINLIGQCGPVLGTRLYPKHEGSRYAKGMGICAAFMFFAAAVALGLRVLLGWENGRLERKYAGENEKEDGVRGRVGDGDGDGDGKEGGRVVGEENYGPGFRYVL